MTHSCWLMTSFCREERTAHLTGGRARPHLSCCQEHVPPLPVREEPTNLPQVPRKISLDITHPACPGGPWSCWLCLSISNGLIGEGLSCNYILLSYPNHFLLIGEQVFATHRMEISFYPKHNFWRYSKLIILKTPAGSPFDPVTQSPLVHTNDPDSAFLRI